MKEKSWIMLRVLMNRFHERAADALLEGMIQEDQQMVLNQNVQSTEAGKALIQPAERFEGIHYSWLVPKLKEFPDGMVTHLLSALPQSDASKLKNILQKDVPLTNSLSSSMKTFLLNRMYLRFDFKEVLPIDFLPPTPLEGLINLSKNELVELIDFLGMYDLAVEVKRIVDKEKLKQIYETLTKKKHDFLRKILHKREKLMTTKLNLEYWDGDHQKLNRLLHRRGIVRLGYSLSGQHPDFVWHIRHRLDIGRGSKMMEYYNEEEIPGVTNAIVQHVRTIIETERRGS